MTRFRYGKTLVGFCALMIALGNFSFFTLLVTAQQDTNAVVALRPGILFDPTVNVAYVMTPDGIAAIDLATGAKRWTSSAAAKPLALSGNLLISQVEPRTAGNRIELVALNTQERGAPTVRGVTELPPGVRVAIGQTLEGEFSVEAQSVGANVFLIWTFERLPIRGIVEETDETVKSPGQLRVQQAYTRGGLQMNLTTGTVTLVAISVTSFPPTRRWILTTAEKINSAAPTQYESADGRHILASERVGDDRVFDKYRWTVFDRATGARLGEFRTHLAFAPFEVRDSTLFYETTPYIRAGRSEPAKLRGVSLTTGQEVWSVEVRELAYRGPYPP